ncbi:TetR/AcrR family transcriptional regulator [Shewanella gelidimarina]|uniref:TetR/AcrR family transcriptional regulator n=1 Tax=Shewanella gelidimarina TaxID=56813 RepID=UPI00200E171D|nr:TetR/AcrR family transcriptional regulator [Shewanella gelidimarina]MCL1060195.1 TetR/AcrR family transcriptional regulator [Shewanella gelidimarina]
MTQKRQQILDATLELAVDTGIDAISTLNIAKKAGVAKATLFHHFQTKAELIDAVYKSIKSDFDFFSAPENLSFSDQFIYMWRSNLGWAIENPHKIVFLNAYYTAMSIPNERRLVAKKESTIGLYNLIVSGQESKQVASEKADILVEFIYSLFMSTALLIHSQLEITAEEYIEDSLSVILRVVKP